VIRLTRYIVLLMLALAAFPALAQDEPADDEPPARPKVDYTLLPRQLRFSLDMSKPVAATMVKDRRGYELMADYHFRKDLYAVAEGGWGSVDYRYPDLSYASSNGFLRLGIDKNMLPRLSLTDWDMVFVGARYGMAFINRGAATYTTTDSLWGTTTGVMPAKTFTGHWIEVTGGMRVEIVRSLFVGWNIRGRFRMNHKAFSDLAPAYVAGYGKGDRKSTFDFNFYLGYALRWKKAGQRTAVTASPESVPLPAPQPQSTPVVSPDEAALDAIQTSDPVFAPDPAESVPEERQLSPATETPDVPPVPSSESEQ